MKRGCSQRMLAADFHGIQSVEEHYGSVELFNDPFAERIKEFWRFRVLRG